MTTTRSVDRLFARYARTGDPGALAVVFDQTAPEVLRVASHFVRDQAEAEDLLQETFLSAIERADTFTFGERVVPWLLAILINQARMRHRRGRRAAGLNPAPREDVEDPAEAAHEREVQEQVQVALAGMPQPYREVLQCHLDGGQSGTQIAHSLGRSPNTVRSQLRRGLQLLRGALPVGLAVGCQPAPTRGLAAVRDLVITRGAAHTGAAVGTASWIGGWLVMKKVTLAAGAVALAAAAWWIGTEGFGGGEDPVPLVETAVTEPEVDSTPIPADPVVEPAAGDVAERSAVVAEPVAGPGPDERYTAALASFTGRVLQSDESPAQDAEVELFRFDPEDLVPAGSAPELVAARARTDDAGHFRLSRVPPRAVFIVRAGHAGQKTLRLVERTPGPGEEVDLGDLVLPAPTSIVGVVTDPDGEPVAGALVSAIDLPAMFLGMLNIQQLDLARSQVIVRADAQAKVMQPPAWLRKTLTDVAFATARSAADGTFELSGVHPGANAVVVSADGFVNQMKSGVRARAGQKRDLGRIRLRMGELATVRVLDAAGLPVPGAEVLVGPRTAARPMDFVTPAPRTDAQGRTELRGLPPGRLTVAARRSADHSWVLGRADGPTGNLEVKLPQVCELTLAVRAAGGLPVAGARVRVALGGATGSAYGERLGLDCWVTADAFVTDAEGRLVLADLEAGKHTVEISAAGHVRRRVAVELQTDKLENVMLDRDQPGVIRVVDAAGTPVRHAEVVVRPAGAEVIAMAAAMRGASSGEEEGTGTFRGRTDGDGRCVVEGLAPGQMGVVARHPAFGIGHTEIAWPHPELTLRLPEAGAIEGRVVGHDSSPEAALPRLIVTPVGADELELARVIVAERDGRFEVRGLTPGTYELRPGPALDSVRSPGSAMRYLIVTRDEAAQPPRCEVRSGEVARVVVPFGNDTNVDLDAGVIRGTAWIDGRPAKGVRVMVLHRGMSSAIVGDDGRFELKGIHGPKANIALMNSSQLGPSSGTHWRKEMQLADVGPELRIEVATGSLSGRVVDAEGAGVSGVMVMAIGMVEKDGVVQEAVAGRYRSAYQTESDAQGRFSFAVVAAGHYELHAQQGRELEGSAKGIQVRDGGQVVDAVVEMK